MRRRRSTLLPVRAHAAARQATILRPIRLGRSAGGGLQRGADAFDQDVFIEGLGQVAKHAVS